MRTFSSVMLVASFPDSILAFRGSLIAEMQTLGLEVGVAAPDLPVGNPLREELEAIGVTVQDIPSNVLTQTPLEIYCCFGACIA